MLIVSRRMAGGYSAPANDYITRVIAADVAAGNSSGLETATQDAYATFIDGLITDGLLGVSGGVISQASSLLKASCILAGARTVAGCLVPLVGGTITNVGGGFGSADYNRKNGLTGNGSKYIRTSLTGTSLPSFSNHMFMSKPSSASASNLAAQPVVMGAGDSPLNDFYVVNTSFNYRGNGSSIPTGMGSLSTCISRTASNAISVYTNGSSTFTDSSTVSGGLSNNFYNVFGRNSDGSNTAGIALTMNFFSFGSGLTATNASNLHTRTQALMTALAAAIP